MANLESEVQRWCVQYLKDKLKDDIYLFKMPISQYTSRRGIPDLICSIYGQFVGIEVKTEKGALTEIQRLELNRIRMAGGISIVVYGKEEFVLDEVIEKCRPKIR